MKILLLGGTGALGWELQRALAPLGEVVAPGRDEVDLQDLSRLRANLRSLVPKLVVNAAAYSDVDRAESDVKGAERINFEAVNVLAEETARLGAWLVHYSTDYVFDGAQTRPYREDDPARPLSVYGRTKLAGEEAVRACGSRHLIFRTSWLFGARGDNFVKTILRLARERDEIPVVADQHGAPTSAELVADITALALYRMRHSDRPDALQGTYHVTAAGETSWYHYARFVLAQAAGHGVALRAGPDGVRAISSAEYPLPAARPASSRLDTSRLRTTLHVHLADWRSHVARLVHELTTRGDA